MSVSGTLMIRLNIMEVLTPFSVPHITGHIMSLCLTTVDINLDHLVKMMIAGFRYYKAAVLFSL